MEARSHRNDVSMTAEGASRREAEIRTWVRPKAESYLHLIADALVIGLLWIIDVSWMTNAVRYSRSDKAVPC